MDDTVRVSEGDGLADAKKDAETLADSPPAAIHRSRRSPRTSFIA